jgi:sodium/proline symporter
MNGWIIAVMVIYLFGMIFIGLKFSKNSKNIAEFFLGGRKLGPLVTAMSAEASDMSSYLLMGLPGLALAAGLAEVSWTAIGLGIGTYLNWLIVARRIRVYSHKINAVTIPEFISKRFGDNKHILSLAAAVVIVVFFIPYAASGFNACGTLFNSLSGGSIPYFTAMLVSAIVIVAYTALGGFLAASTTDLIQSIVMSIALVVVLFFGIHYAGGWDNVAANAHNIPSYLGMTSTYDYVTGSAVDFGFLPIVSTLAWGLGYFGMPHILLRFMAINDSKNIKTSRRIATVWVFLSMGIAILIGIIGSAAIANGAIDLDAANGQRIIVEFAKLMGSHSVILAIVGGIVLSGILAATMSTADSQLLAASSSVSKDIAMDFFGIKMSDKTSMIISRLVIVLIAVIGVIWARNEGSVFTIVSFAWAGFGAAFGPAILCGLFWKRTNKWGILAGMVGGGAMIFIWKYAVRPLGGAFNIYELLPAFIFALILIVVVSLLTGKPDKEIEDTFDAVNAELKESN